MHFSSDTIPGHHLNYHMLFKFGNVFCPVHYDTFKQYFSFCPITNTFVLYVYTRRTGMRLELYLTRNSEFFKEHEVVFSINSQNGWVPATFGLYSSEK